MDFYELFVIEIDPSSLATTQKIVCCHISCVPILDMYHSLNSIWYLVVWKNWMLREQLQYHHDWRCAIDAHGHVKGGSCHEQKKCEWMFDNALVT